MNEIVLNKLFIDVKLDDVIRVFHDPTNAFWSGKVIEIDEEVITMIAINPIENEWSVEPYNEKCSSKFFLKDISMIQKKEKVINE